MVEFNQDHKGEMKATSGHKNKIIDFYNEAGDWAEIDVSKIDTPNLWELRHTVKKYLDAQLQVIDSELDNWTTIKCTVCERDDLAYRGQPFISWGIRAGFFLCPKHLAAYDRMGTPEGEIVKKMKEESADLKAIFG